MAELEAEVTAVVTPDDHPDVVVEDGEAVLRPAANMPLVIGFEAGDLERWATEVVERAREGYGG